jgi:phosphatidylglycerol:prolipoprotein diacylglycerol transferase
MYLAGVLIALFFVRKRGKQLKIDTNKLENVVLVSFLGGIIGARIYYDLLKWDFYSNNPFEMIAFWHGGLAIHGGIIGGILTGYLYSRKIFKPIFLMDLILPFLLLGQAIGRFGNFANGEAHGVPTITPPSIIFRVKNVFPEFWQTVKHTFNLPDGTDGMNILYDMVKAGKTLAVNFEGKIYYLKEYVPWGISFPPKYNPPAYMEFGLLPVHPTFFYEMILNFIGAFILIKLWKKDYLLGKGVITGLYLIFYGIIRGVVTTFRADDLMIGLIRAPHLISIVLIIVGFLFVRYGVAKKNG